MQENAQKRQTWTNTLTYILTVAGATIGFGATWRFPYLVGENGGAAFVLVFCVAMIIIGIPVILVENVIGRRAQKNSVDAFYSTRNAENSGSCVNLSQNSALNLNLNENLSSNLHENSTINSSENLNENLAANPNLTENSSVNLSQISPQNSALNPNLREISTPNLTQNKAWLSVGYLGLLGSFGIMAYYMVLGGWVLVYIYELIFGGFDLGQPVGKDYTHEFYTQNIEHNPLLIGVFTGIFVLINYVILRRGIINGIEKSVKFLMPLLFLCLIIVIVRNLSLDGAMRGVEFYLKPDFSKITPKLLIDVLGQVFFALSLGFGVMITLSSHLKKDENLIKTASYTGILNTLIAVLAGFMIFPALFSAGLAPDKGPSLVFETLPIAFSYVKFGTAVCALFFVLLLIAALTTSLPIYQVIISVLEEKFRLSKNAAINLTLSVIFVLGNLPCILSYGAWRDIKIVGEKNIFDSFDFISGNVLFVLTALFCCIFVGWVMKDAAIDEISNGGKIKSRFIKIWFYYVKFIVPLIIAVIFYFGIFG